MYARNSLENVLKKDYQKTLKNFVFFQCMQCLFMDKFMKNKSGLGLVTGLFLGCKTCFKESSLPGKWLDNFIGSWGSFRNSSIKTRWQ